MITKLNDLFTIRYGKEIESFNKNMYKAAKDDNGNYEVPVVTLGPGGGTAITGNVDVFKLKAPAIVKIENKKMKAYTIIYRVAIPYSEAEIAANKPEYFNYLFDSIVAKAISNYRATVGDENKVRFGDKYLECLPMLQLSDNDGNDYIELRLHGNWASDEVAT